MPPNAAPPKTGKRVFLASVALASVAPYVLIPLILAPLWPFELLAGQLITYLAIVHMHQLSSYFFYLDVDALQVMRGNKRFFFLYPALAFSFCGAFFAFAPEVAIAPYWIVFTAITFHHFQKQNLGLYVLASSHFHDIRAGLFERRLLVGALWVALLGWKNVYTDVLDPYLPQLKLVAALLQAGLVLGFGWLVTQRVREHGLRHLKATWPAYLLLLFFVTFYWPALALDSGMAFMMFGGAHGVQYLLMMLLISVGYGRRLSRGVGVPILHGAVTALTVSGFLLFSLSFEGTWQWLERLPVPVAGVSQARFSQFVYGWLSAFALVHYIIDARMWRFSLKDSRDYMRSRLAVAF